MTFFNPTEMELSVSNKIVDKAGLQELMTSDLMKQRAQAGYCASASANSDALLDRADLFPINPADNASNNIPTDPNLGDRENTASSTQPSADADEVRWVWKLMRRVKRLLADQDMDLRKSFNQDFRFGAADVKIPGVSQILSSQSSDTTNRSMSLMKDGKETGVTVVQYMSKDRNSLLELCGWGNVICDPKPFQQEIKTLVANGKLERAATLLILMLHLDDAVETLSQATNEVCRVAALALAGFQKDSKLWQKKSSSLLASPSSFEKTHPYLRIMFKFLSALCDSSPNKNDYFAEVFNDPGWVLEDLIGFSALYLPPVSTNTPDGALVYDSKTPRGPVGDVSVHGLKPQLLNKMHYYIKAGCLKGLLLTGLPCSNAVNLIQEYVDRSGDVQTAALIAVHAGFPGLPSIESAGPGPTTTSSRPRVWVETYVDLLNKWGLWKVRVEFERALYEPDLKFKRMPSMGAYPCCLFCHQPLQPLTQLSMTAGGLGLPGATAQQARASRSTARHTMCVNCKRPKPRCAICLAHIGNRAVPTLTAGEQGSAPSSSNGVLDREDSSSDLLSDWLTFCQRCHHGGHAVHMQQWFKEQSECPVTGCQCQCSHISKNHDNQLTRSKGQHS